MSSENERTMMRDSIRTLLLRHWPAAKAVELAARPGAITEIWKHFAEQGYSALGPDPSDGGLEGILIVMEELGRAACNAPLLDGALINLAFADASPSLPDAGALLARTQSGEVFPCVSFGALDPDGAVGRLDFAEGAVTGRIDFAEAASSATHFVVFTADGPGALLIPAANDGVSRTATRAMGADGLFAVEFTRASATRLPIAAARIEDLLSISRLCHAARAWGAADRAFELVVAYVKDRKQFGQPVGRFQAIQHKLADNLIGLMGVQLSLKNAAVHYDKRIDDWRTFASAAYAYANVTLRQVSLDTHHAFGAIGYAEDHEAPRHFKRVHLDIMRHGGGRVARDHLAVRYLGDGPAKLPEFDLGEAGNAFRQEVRNWLAEHWSKEHREAYAARKTIRDFDAAFARELGKTGWLGLAWPKKFGGLERSTYELLAFMEEMTRAETPRAGAPIQAVSWMIYGTPEQHERYLPEIRRGEVIYGMWYSEPDSGSDLASLRTKAVLDGDEWVINGEKIWTTTYWGDYMWLAARTSDTGKQHEGISMFVVPTNTLGITRHPIKTMYDGEFCNTFFDNVRLKKDALVGQVNHGWEVLTGSLGTERAFVGSTILAKVIRQFEEFCNHVRELDVNGRPARLDPVVRDTIGWYAAQLEAGRQLALHSVHTLANGVEPTWEAAVGKVFAGELMERFTQFTLDVMGMAGTLSTGNALAPLNGEPEQKLRHSLMWVISMGTNEIQRTMIAQRGLGLPR